MKDKLQEPEKIVDEIAQQVIDALGKPKPVQSIRNSQIVSAILGATGLALFLVGVEKVFAPFTGGASIAIGILLMGISGALLSKLR
ncbi:hypothetical protein A2801_01040 [Candidatus Woesebacteria bacterium RIFCSPHIGHO2_01_FULL_41_10]|uniref:Uncharacterized protein n=1 Tax=Candidatus Woesebacteria bacterium RIFCSPHIGHO2_01_FULL_41_10 TaxID=1802500 RepID=A0A1F7YNN2_9BACT|nr:MAG: hypothetical protein A2801_01040 [Candidatus Woesebacteria bacterium RIFCSPHIGHO2_01_FULL_41_10]